MPPVARWTPEPVRGDEVDVKAAHLPAGRPPPHFSFAAVSAIRLP
jgi:hypothetical protein